jgi:3-oxoacyl-[acyl-carrier protein] reductase
MAVDLKGTWLCSRAAAEVMASRGQGAIVNMSWDHVLSGMGNPTAAIYAAAKGGILALSRCLAREFAPRVRVNVVAPGWIKTKWAETADEGVSRAVVQATPLARWGRPDDVAAAVLFLASAESAFITGETILVGGGAVMA